MASTISVQVQGLSSLVRDLQKMGVDVEDLRDAWHEIATEVIPDYQRHVPYRTGRLRADFRAGRAKGKASITVGRAAVPYAGPINYGWGKANASWKHGKYAKGLKGTFPGVNFVQKGDVTAAPKASESFEDAISELVRKLNLG